MPNRPPHPCPGVGPRRGRCSSLIKASESYCEECKPFVKKATREYDKKRDQTLERKFLHSRSWRKERNMYLDKHPLCERCLPIGRTVPAVLVHHKDRNELNRAEENKEALCNSCHEAEHKGERWGK